MATDDVHTPTNAGPATEPAAVVADKSPTFEVPPVEPAPLERPEVQAGAAFAGGILAALILKRLGR